MDGGLDVRGQLMAEYPAGITHRKRISGVRHWRWQRFSAVAVLFLMSYLVIALASIGGMSYGEALSFVSQPVNAAALGALVLAGLFHGTMGLQVVIEDYISARGGRHAALLLVRAGMSAAALASLWAMVRILG